jgi:hypothetical protein
MTKWKLLCRTGGAVLVLALGVGVWHEAAQGQKTKGKTRPAPTKALMKGIQLPNCAALAGLLKEGPSDEKGWDKAALHATVLNEMSYVLMDDNRCPDKIWFGACKTLREGSGKVADAAKEKDLAAAQAAFKVVTSACSACHKEHRK